MVRFVKLTDGKYSAPDWSVATGEYLGGRVMDKCKHGVHHPNQDWLASVRSARPDLFRMMSMHGCDGCCNIDTRVAYRIVPIVGDDLLHDGDLLIDLSVKPTSSNRILRISHSMRCYQGMHARGTVCGRSRGRATYMARWINLKEGEARSRFALIKVIEP
jgi:hypothetical protein